MHAEKLKQARLAAGMTLEQAVRQLEQRGVSLTRAGLSKYEHAGSAPGNHVLLQLAAIYKVQLDYFFSPLRINWVGFRKLAALRKHREEHIKFLAQNRAEKMLDLMRTLNIDDKPDFPKRKKINTPDNVEEAAQSLRRHWKLGEAPIERLTKVFEDKGGIVVQIPSEEHFDGLAGMANKHPVVVMAESGVKHDRVRFNLAHELGHLILDLEGRPEKEQEKLAHRFAGAFLVPEKVARQELGDNRRRLSWSELGILKREYGMSMQAWICRAKDLGIITDKHYSTLFAEMSKLRWRKEEPIDYIGHETPSRYRKLVLRAIAEGVVAPDLYDDIAPELSVVQDVRTDDKPAMQHMSPQAFLKLSKKNREKYLQEIAGDAEQLYNEDQELAQMIDWEADDIYEY